MTAAPDPARVREAYRQHLKRRLDQCHVPIALHAGLVEYLAARRPTGGFLRAVLDNDLKRSAVLADDVNRHRLFEIVLFLVSHAPAVAWGSPATVDAWLSDPSEVPCGFD